MSVLNADKINKKAEEYAKEVEKRHLLSEVDEQKKRKEETEKEKRDISEGKRILEALREFHHWAMKNNIPTIGKTTTPRLWWNNVIYWWRLDAYSEGLYSKDMDVHPDSTLLIVLKKKEFVVAKTRISHFTGQYRIIEKNDYMELSKFSLSGIENAISHYVQESGVSFR